MTSLNLLFVIPAYEPAWAFGGVVGCLSNLCRGLAALGHKVTVYTINSDGQGSELDVPQGQPVIQGGVETYFFPSTFGPRSIFDSRALVGRLRKTVASFDLVYVSAIWQWLGLSVASLCARRQIPLVVGTHGSLDKIRVEKHKFRKLLYWQLFLQRAMARATAIHFTTAYERHERTAWLRNLPSFIVPNSLDCHYFRPLKEARDNFRRQYHIPQDAQVLISVARADPVKRLDLLIRALAFHPEYYLLIVGPGTEDLSNQWRELAQSLNVGERVIWTGHLAREEIIEAYAAADIFSLISQDENFAMVVVEALACGLPVLVNRQVGVWEELRGADVGLVVAPQPEAIAGAWQELLREKAARPDWAEHCRQVARDRFDHQKVAGLMAQALAEVLTGIHTPACRWEVI